MPRPRWLLLALVALAAAALLALVWVLTRPEPASGNAVELHRVEGCLEPARDQPYRRAALAARLRAGSTAVQCEWRPIALPLLKEAETGAYSVDQRSVAVQWIRLSYTVPTAKPAASLAFFMPRISGDGWMLWVDGQYLADGLDDWRMTWNRPLVAEMPMTAVPAGRTIDVVLGVPFGADSGLAMTTLHIGPADALRPGIRLRQALQTMLPQVCSATQLLIGTFFFAFWLGRRSETAHLLLAASSVAWSVSNLQYGTPRSDDPTLDRLYDSVVSLATAWVMWLVYAAVGQFGARRLRLIERLLPLYVLVASGMVVVAMAARQDMSVGLQACNSAVAGTVTVVIAWLALRAPTEVRAIAVALVLALAAGVHDLALIAHRVTPTDYYVLPVSSLLVTGAFLFAVQRRYVRAIDERDGFASTLNTKLAQQELELTTSHDRLRVLERARALAEERARLMGDIHDGLGSTLVTTLAALERQGLTQADAARAVRACIDDMRLLVDSLEPVGHDIGLLLAQLRWRIAGRLQAAGIQSSWDLPALTPLALLDAPHALHLLRLLQEAFANILKHAGASHIAVIARDEPAGLVLSVRDDGQGFDPGHDREAGRGLGMMRARAERLGGDLQFHSQPNQGTELRLRLPRTRPGVVAQPHGSGSARS